MAINRYDSALIIAGNFYGTTEYIQLIYKAVEDGTIDYDVHIMKEPDRLDNLAAVRYGSGNLWWIIAAASGIGWGLQVPADTIIRLPKSLVQVRNLIE